MGALKLALDEFYNNAFAPEIVKILSFVESNETSMSLLAKHAPLEGGVKGTSKMEVKDSNATFQTNLLQITQHFERALSAVKLNSDHIIFIDGIDVRPANINYQDYFDCVQGLIEAIWSVNVDYLANIRDSKGRIRIVLLVRPDIFLRAGLHNVNTKLRDNSVVLDWSTTYKDYKTSSLYNVANRLLSVQQEKSEKLRVANAWDYYFPFHAENVRATEAAESDSINSFLAFLRFSYYRPRDINAMIGTMRDIASKKGIVEYISVSNFNDPSFRDAHADYLLGEIKDQLLFYYSQDEYELFLQFFAYLHGKKKFTYKNFVSAFNDFITDCSNSGKELPEFFESADAFFQFMYEQNVICYIENDAPLEKEEQSERKKTERFIRWCFRERTLANLAPKVRLHVEYEIFYGLTKALNVGRRIRVAKESTNKEVGSIISIFDEKGFGFIRDGARQSEYYFKTQEILFDMPAPKVGDKVSFNVIVKYGKLRAEAIERAR